MEASCVLVAILRDARLRRAPQDDGCVCFSSAVAGHHDSSAGPPG